MGEKAATRGIQNESGFRGEFTWAKSILEEGLNRNL